MEAVVQEARQLQRKYYEARNLLERTRERKASLATDKRRTEITLRELETPSTAIYQPFGKMFLSVQSDAIKVELQRHLEVIESENATVLRQEQQFATVTENTEKELLALQRQFQSLQQQQQQH